MNKLEYIKSMNGKIEYVTSEANGDITIDLDYKKMSVNAKALVEKLEDYMGQKSVITKTEDGYLVLTFTAEEATEVASEDLAEEVLEETIDNLNEQITDEQITVENVLEVLYTNGELYTFENVCDMTNDDNEAIDIIEGLEFYRIGYYVDDSVCETVELFKIDDEFYVVDQHGNIDKPSDNLSAEDLFELRVEELC